MAARIVEYAVVEKVIRRTEEEGWVAHPAGTVAAVDLEKVDSVMDIYGVACAIYGAGPVDEDWVFMVAAPYATVLADWKAYRASVDDPINARMAAPPATETIFNMPILRTGPHSPTERYVPALEGPYCSTTDGPFGYPAAPLTQNGEKL